MAPPWVIWNLWTSLAESDSPRDHSAWLFITDDEWVTPITWDQQTPQNVPLFHVNKLGSQLAEWWAPLKAFIVRLGSKLVLTRFQPVWLCLDFLSAAPWLAWSKLGRITAHYWLSGFRIMPLSCVSEWFRWMCNNSLLRVISSRCTDASDWPVWQVRMNRWSRAWFATPSWSWRNRTPQIHTIVCRSSLA